MTERLHFHFSLSRIGGRNGNPLQCSCLENPRDGGAWWAAVYGVTQSRTQLKWLSSSNSLYSSPEKHYCYWFSPIVCRESFSGSHLSLSTIIEPSLHRTGNQCEILPATKYVYSNYISRNGAESPKGSGDPVVQLWDILDPKMYVSSDLCVCVLSGSVVSDSFRPHEP